MLDGGDIIELGAGGAHDLGQGLAGGIRNQVHVEEGGETLAHRASLRVDNALEESLLRRGHGFQHVNDRWRTR